MTKFDYYAHDMKQTITQCHVHKLHRLQRSKIKIKIKKHNRTVLVELSAHTQQIGMDRELLSVGLHITLKKDYYTMSFHRTLRTITPVLYVTYRCH